MTHYLLESAQRYTGCCHSATESVTEEVGVDVLIDAGPLGGPFEDLPELLWRVPGEAAEIDGDFLVDGDDALAVAFAGDNDNATLPIDDLGTHVLCLLVPQAKIVHCCKYWAFLSWYRP